MGITVSLIEITPEAWENESFQKWISGGVEIGEFPKQVSDFRKPKMSDVEAILEEFKDIDVKQTHNGNQRHISFSKFIEHPIDLIYETAVDKHYERLGDIYVTALKDYLTSDPYANIQIDRSSGEQIDKFIQLLANRCGTYLLLHNGEPVQFFVPQTTE